MGLSRCGAIAQMWPQIGIEKNTLGIDPETGLPGSLVDMKKEFLRPLSVLDLAPVYFSGGVGDFFSCSVERSSS